MLLVRPTRRRVVNVVKELARLPALYGALSRARSAAGAPQVDQASLFAGIGDYGWWFVNTSGYRTLPFLRSVLPAMPDEKTQKDFVGRSGDDALIQAFRLYRLFKELAAKHGRPISQASKVIDFGVGWGRFLRFFLRDVAPGNLIGVDVLPRAIELCRETNPWARFLQIEPFPPIDLPADDFDLIYLFSVFSHLSEEAADRWITEFARLLRPGGIVIATTRPRTYFRDWQGAFHSGSKQKHLGAVDAFPNVEEWEARYDRGEFCFSGVGGGKGLDGSFYGETAIPRAYVERRWSDRLELCDFIDDRAVAGTQDIIVLRKRG